MKFDATLALHEADLVFKTLNPGDDIHRKLASMMMNFQPWTRPKIADELCQRYKSINRRELDTCLKGEEFDEAAELRLLSKKAFSLSQYIDMLNKKKEALQSDRWEQYNGSTYTDPNTVMLACIYDMMRHVIWKLTDNEHDISTIALIETGWERAIHEVEKRTIKEI